MLPKAGEPHRQGSGGRSLGSSASRRGRGGRGPWWFGPRRCRSAHRSTSAPPGLRATVRHGAHRPYRHHRPRLHAETSSDIAGLMTETCAGSTPRTGRSRATLPNTLRAARKSGTGVGERTAGAAPHGADTTGFVDGAARRWTMGPARTPRDRRGIAHSGSRARYCGRSALESAAPRAHGLLRIGDRGQGQIAMATFDRSLILRMHQGSAPPRRR